MTLSSFDDLLHASRAQTQPQRLLMVFVAVELPPEASADERERFERGQGGSLMPRMCVDRSPDELSGWEALVSDADAQASDWRMVFVGALSGSVGQAAPAEAVDRALNRMVADIHQGLVQSYAVLDRQGASVHLV